MRNYLHIPQPDDNARARFWRKVRRADNGCWLWTGHADKFGRGFFFFAEHQFRAPRVAWAIAHGRSPELDICHTCDNPACVNPDHLWEGSHAENMRDASSKGRWLRSHCPKGHEYTPENTYYRKTGQVGSRICRTCSLAAANAYNRRARAERIAPGRVAL